MTVTVPELVPEASPRTQIAVVFLPENFRGQTELGQEGKSASYPRVQVVAQLCRNSKFYNYTHAPLPKLGFSTGIGVLNLCPKQGHLPCFIHV